MWRSDWYPLVLFGLVAVALLVVVRLTVWFLPSQPVPPHGFPDLRFFEGWARYDTDWYWRIARDGYFYAGPGVQSAVAFFPAYPFTMRAVALVVRQTLVAGVLVTYACGAGAAVLFHRWARRFVGERSARFGVALLLLYPFSYYLFGVVYSDALFVLAALGAFLLLEEDRPVLAGLAGAVATACRPVGLALIVGFGLRVLERRGWSLRRLRWGDVVGAALVVGGLLAYMALLWIRFDEPLAFERVGSAEGWHRELTLRTAAKVIFFRLFVDYPLNVIHLGLSVQAVATVGALLSIPAVVRRFGWGYGAYVLVAVGLPAASSNQFIGLGRYVVAAFPVFGAVGDVLVTRFGARVRWGVLAVSAGLLAFMLSLFVRWYFLA